MKLIIIENSTDTYNAICFYWKAGYADEIEITDYH
jgi:hypothetical protein